MVDDPSSHPELFPTYEAQEKERQRLFRIIENLVQWENTTNETVFTQAREEIWKSWRSTCADNKNHPQAKDLFDPQKLPAFHDPFAGGGALPLEALRLGLDSYASDLNPVAVLITKAMIEIPPRFAGKPPINPEARENKALFQKRWHGAEGLAEDVRYYGKWMRDEAEKRIGHLYPKVEITPEMINGRPDLKPEVGKKLTVVAWLWARTVKSPNPAFAQVEVPLVASFWLSTKKGKEAWIDPVLLPGKKEFYFAIRTGGTPRLEETVNRRGGVCLMSGTPMPFPYIRGEAKAGRMGARLMAIVAEGARSRLYLPPTQAMEKVARSARPNDVPETDLPPKALGFRIQEYGMTRWRDLFTPRQLVALTTFCDLVQEARARVKHDALTAGMSDDQKPLAVGGKEATAYADAVSMYLAFCVDKMTDTNTTLCSWQVDPPRLRATFGRQALPMVWDFAEANIFGDAAGDFGRCVQSLAEVLDRQGLSGTGCAQQADAQALSVARPSVFSTDPPYYDNIGYADLSDFFYIWLRRALKTVFPDLFAMLEVPKAQELVATPFRHGDREKAETFFLKGMTRAMHCLEEQAHKAFPVTIYYAFKQSESSSAEGLSSTGWETFLDALIKASFAISGTWPMRSELATRNVGRDTNALASSIILVCRPLATDAPTTTRREFITALKAELPEALKHLQRSNIAPVDLAQAAIGPGMAVYTRYSKVLDASGKALSVGEALSLINQILGEVLAEQEGDFDADTRWALAWFEQAGFGEGDYGLADTLSKAKNTSVGGMADAGILVQGRGKVRLLKPSELPKNWDPENDARLTAWETVHQLVRSLEADGESSAGTLVAKLGRSAETSRELAYRLYTICERKKRAQEALSYNSLVQSWPEIVRLSREGGTPRRKQTGLFEESEE